MQVVTMWIVCGNVNKCKSKEYKFVLNQNVTLEIIDQIILSQSVILFYCLITKTKLS